VILVLVGPLLRHSLLSLPLEAKLILVAISPAIAIVKLYGLRVRPGMGLIIRFLSTRLLNRFLLTRLLNRFLLTSLLILFPKVLINLIGFWRSLVCGGNMGAVGVVSSRFLRWFGLGTKAFLWWVFGGSGIFSPLPSPTMFAQCPSPSWRLYVSIIILN
jgi:hypothetical protein